MEYIYFTKKSQMTSFAIESGKEMIRCKQPCKHVPEGIRPAILLIESGNIITHRLIKCKVCNCAQKGGHYE